jgi:malate synthase
MASYPWYSSHVDVPACYQTQGCLKVHPCLVKTVEEVVCPGTGFSPNYFWTCLEQAVRELRPQLERCLARRDEIQAKIDAFHLDRVSAGEDIASPELRPKVMEFLRDIGYLEPDKGPVAVETTCVDPEIAKVPAPQLVVPSDNARYVLNAVNARWGSLYDALYGFDVIPTTKVQAGSSGGAGADLEDNAKDQPKAPKSGYNEVRGEAVIAFANELLDEIAPLAAGKWCEVTRLWPKFVGQSMQLMLLLQSGTTTSLKTPSLFVGHSGTLGPPDAAVTQVKLDRSKVPCMPDQGKIFLKHNGLHLILVIDQASRVGKSALSGIKDIVCESALTAILDMEDSVSAVDAEDKSKVYTNICGVLRGTLCAPIMKGGKQLQRKMNGDIWMRDTDGKAKMIPGRSICLIRNVGHHMFTDMVVTKDGKPVPEGFLDCFVTAAAALHDLRGTGEFMNSRTGSVYIVKPKQHGSEEIALTSRLFCLAEQSFGLRRNTIKMGIMDEERRTSVNLRECIRAAADRVFFINTGFLDRTGDEIHTCFHAGPVVRKADMRKETWIKAYEDSNVDVGLFSGFQGKGQIGKGMWAKPDSMKTMLETKIQEPMAGASTAWVPSPSAGVLHSIHYHRVDVPARQMQLAMRAPAKLEDILQPPLLKSALTKEEIMHELRENAQSILGYVVRWVDLGVGCSKVPDLSNVGLMEDRATLRISSQLMANWLRHGLVSDDEVRTTFLEMARLVDQQNASDRSYRPMATDPDSSIAFQAAIQLVQGGEKIPNGYTEFTLHEARRKVKAQTLSRM